MMDLAAANGIKVIIAELVTSAPEWAFRKYAPAKYLASDGTVLRSSISASSAVGGFPGLCLDNVEVKAAADRFLTALIERYRKHPALLGYDLWNENTYDGGNPHRMYCYGGTLICEGLPAYFGDHGHVGTVQPNTGLDEMFGAREKYVEFNPDISNELMFEVKGSKIYGRYFRQDYDLHGGRAVGQYSDGSIAAVENTFGQGRTLLMGSFPGAGYFLHHGSATMELFASFLKMAGVAPQVRVDDHSVQARLHQGPGGTHLWVTNPTRVEKIVKLSLMPGAGEFRSAEDLWGKVAIMQSGQQFTISVPARDAVVAALR